MISELAEWVYRGAAIALLGASFFVDDPNVILSGLLLLVLANQQKDRR